MAFALNGPVVLAGAGKMGAALLSGWIEAGLQPRDVVVQDPYLSDDAAVLLRKHAVNAVPRLGALPAPPSVIVVAVKPQVIDAVFPLLAEHAGPGTVVMSIAAGKSIASFERNLRQGSAVVRAMPNTPAAIGRGITGAVANRHVSEAQKAICQSLLGAVGEVVWLENEALIDAVTAVSGSGPAYVFLLAEALARAGEIAGLDAKTAMQLARATVAGAGELLSLSALDPAMLRENVTSPGGTTAAALSVLMRQGGSLQDLLTEAVLAAQKRGRELGS
jgi:pyrroline-5-carboxylate reductase